MTGHPLLIDLDEQEYYLRYGFTPNANPAYLQGKSEAEQLNYAIELIEDFSGGQFYILESDIHAPIEYLQKMLWASEVAMLNRHLLSDWGLSVASKLATDLVYKIRHEYQLQVEYNRPHVVPTRTSKPGYVYLLKSPLGAYKIGKTSNPDNRIKTFSVKLPFEVEYTCVIKCVDMNELEKRLHAKFADKRINGEWFALTTDDIEYIRWLSQ